MEMKNIIELTTQTHENNRHSGKNVLRPATYFEICKNQTWMDGERNGQICDKLRYADDTILMAESEEELKRLLMKVKKLA